MDKAKNMHSTLLIKVHRLYWVIIFPLFGILLGFEVMI